MVGTNIKERIETLHQNVKKRLKKKQVIEFCVKDYCFQINEKGIKYRVVAGSNKYYPVNNNNDVIIFIYENLKTINNILNKELVNG